MSEDSQENADDATVEITPFEFANFKRKLYERELTELVRDTAQFLWRWAPESISDFKDSLKQKLTYDPYLLAELVRVIDQEGPLATSV